MAPFGSFKGLCVQAVLLGFAAGTKLSEGEQASSLRSAAAEDATDQILQPVQEPLQDLMICNGYATSEPLHIFDLTKKTQISTKKPLAYKDCSSFQLPLVEGEQLDFRNGNVSVGIFRARSVPQTSASLLLIVHRRHPSGVTAAFSSHAFTQLEGSQLVIIDVYRGNATGKVQIADKPSGTQVESPRLEELRFNSVVQVSPGTYEITLRDGSKDLAAVPLMVSAKKDNYVIMRTGNEPKTADSQIVSFPQELVLRQQHELGGARTVGLTFLVAAVVALLSNGI